MSICSFSVRRAAALLVLLGMVACTPVMDWREVRPEGAGVVVLFPCKPDADARTVTLADAGVRMTLVACRVADATYALATADVVDPARVAPALASLRAAIAENLAARQVVRGALQVPGMTPNPRAERVLFDGRLPEAEAVTLEAGFFAKGTRVFQATVMGARLDEESVSTFFDSLKLPA